MKRPILTGGAGELFLLVAGEEDPVRIPLSELTITVADETTPIRADFQRQPTTIKIGNRTVTIRATMPKLVDGKPVWGLFGFEATTGTLARKPKQEILTIPSSEPYELAPAPDSGYSVDWDSLVVVDYDGDSPTGAQYDRVSGAPTESGTYQVDEDNNLLVFASVDAGKRVLIQYLEEKSGTVYQLGRKPRRCASLEAAFPILDEYGCPADFSRYIVVKAPRVVPTSDFTLTATEGEANIEVEFTALADPAGYSVYISPNESQ